MDSAKSDNTACNSGTKGRDTKSLEISLGRHFSEINDIIWKCVHADPNMRPTCETILEKLESILDKVEREHGGRSKHLPCVWSAMSLVNEEKRVHKLQVSTYVNAHNKNS